MIRRDNIVVLFKVVGRVDDVSKVAVLQDFVNVNLAVIFVVEERIGFVVYFENLDRMPGLSPIVIIHDSSSGLCWSFDKPVKDERGRDEQSKKNKVG